MSSTIHSEAACRISDARGERSPRFPMGPATIQSSAMSQVYLPLPPPA